MWIVFYGLIILTSVFTLPMAKEAFWLPKNAVYVILGFTFIASSWIDTKPRWTSYRNKWLGAILVYTILSFGWFFFKPLIITNPNGKIVWNMWNYLPTINLILGLFLIKTLVEYYYDQIVINLSKLLCWLCFGFSVYSILQFIGVDQLFGGGKWILNTRSGHMITFFGNSMHTANFIAILMPIFLIFKERKYGIMCVVSVIALFLTMSAISIVGMITSFILFLFLIRRRWLAVLISVSCILLGLLSLKIYPSLLTFGDRFAIWKMVLVECLKLPYTGCGLGSFVARGFEIRHVLVNATCLEILQIFHDGGLIMLVLVVGYFMTFFRRIFTTELTILLIGYLCAFVSYLVISCGSFPLRIAPLALVGLIYISVLEYLILVKGE